MTRTFSFSVSMSDFEKLGWYYHRLKAMTVAEICGHLRKKTALAFGRRTFESNLRGFARASGGLEAKFDPLPLPRPENALPELCLALKIESKRILDGRWLAFGHVPLHVDTPPRWHKDYLVGIDLATDRPSHTLNHRALPGGADIKLVWELSRWTQLVTLSQAAFVNRESSLSLICLEWIEDWLDHNPPFKGWNWTSALESGMRLVQFVWIDELCSGIASRDGDQGKVLAGKLESIRERLLPAHVWMTWNARSFGSSANNHLIGELAGLILAVARWPALSRFCVPLEVLKTLWETEVLCQFAPDGGNREQALNYQLFSWEFCWQVCATLGQRSVPPSEEVQARLELAAQFFRSVWKPGGWDYGDSDSAFVTPLVMPGQDVPTQWWLWFSQGSKAAPAVDYWSRPLREVAGVGRAWTFSAEDRTRTDSFPGWTWFKDTGLALCDQGRWSLRWDVGPLGYLQTAAHGHLDALHCSITYDQEPWVIDPGTGAYYGDKRLRQHLSSWDAHNGPVSIDEPHPRRLGPFLWACHHAKPSVSFSSGRGLSARVGLSQGISERSIQWIDEGIHVEDCFQPASGASPGQVRFRVRWQFPPGASLTRIGETRFRIQLSPSNPLVMEIAVSDAWIQVEVLIPPENGISHPFAGSFDGVCSPRFRSVARGPQLRLTGDGRLGSPTWTRFYMPHAGDRE